MNHFLDEYQCKCKEEFSIYNFIKAKEEEKKKYKIKSEDDEKDKPIKLSLPSQGRQLFTRWRWSYPNSPGLKSKTFYIKYERKLSTVDKIILNSFQNKYLYHAIDDILYSLKSKPFEQNNLLAIIYSPVLSLQNKFSIDFFDIWIDEIYINEVSKANKFLTNDHQNFQPFSYITLKLLYTMKLPTKKPESFW